MNIYKKILISFALFSCTYMSADYGGAIKETIALPDSGNFVTYIHTITGFNVPLSIAITPDGNYAYVLNLRNNSANVIATETNTLVNTPGLNNIFNVPQSIAITPDGHYAYVASAAAGSVVVIDTSSSSIDYNTVIPAPALTGNFDYPESLAITPDGLSVYVANGNVNVIDTLSNTITTTITGFVVPDFVAITPNGHYAYVTNLFDGVSVVDTQSNMIIPTPGLTSGFIFPQSVTITPNGQYAYVANGGGTNSVVVIDTATNTIISTPGLDGVFASPVSIAFAPNGFYGYVSNSANNTVSVIDTQSNTVVYIIPGFSNPQTIAITPDGRYAYVANAGNNTVSVIFIGLNGPINPQGCKRKNIFLTQIDNYNYLTWSAPWAGNTPVSYRIYRDAGLTQLVATVPAAGLSYYDDHNRNPNLSYTYYIVTIDASGNISAPSVITVTNRCC